MEQNPIFTPAFGKESKILGSEYNEGWVYFATDSKKIYLDANGEAKLPMGGNSGIYYGQLIINEDEVDDSQTEFTFTMNDLEPDEHGKISIPNKNDLILNIPDGCFYRVDFIEEQEGITVITTKKLTIAGSSSSGSGGGNLANISFNFITPQEGLTLLYQSDYNLQLGVTVTDRATGDKITDQGNYELIVNSKSVKTGTLNQDDKGNSIPIGEYLNLGADNKIILIATVNIGNGAFDTRRLRYTIKTTQAQLVWDYESDITDYGNPNRRKRINDIHNDFILSYRVTGSAGEKSAILVIDDMHPFDLGKFTNDSRAYTFTPEMLQSYGITHGVHKFSLSASINLNGNTTPLGTINKNIIFIDPADTTPIISCDFFETKIKQYNTTFIPISIYSSANIANSAVVDLSVDGEPTGSWSDMQNLVVKDWTYTPVVDGYHLLTIQYNDAQTNLSLEVESLNLGIDGQEVSDYAFRLKASDFPNPEAVPNWNSNGVTLKPSPNFDWNNGGLQHESDSNGNNRSFINIKAGTNITINYPLFKNFAFGRGRTLKMIFKTRNCKDYDATILKCSKYRKLLSYDSENRIYLPIENGESVLYSNIIDIENETLVDPKLAVYDRTNEESRTLLANKYILFENEFYICYFEKDEATEEWLGYWLKVNFIDGFEGLQMQAQSTTLRSLDSVISTQYCEDSYIEFEYDISTKDPNNIKNYIKIWIDGVPAGYVIYSSTDSFNLLDDYITIGSDDCDVQLYMIKVYDKSLTDNEHIRNFIADAPNAEEMLARFNRNDIKDDDRSDSEGKYYEISYSKLAKKNPECYVHLYDIPRMTTRKKDYVYGCTYDQFKDSEDSILHAEGVTIKVQGTSSEYYVAAAANIDSNFKDTDSPYTPTGFINPATGEKYEDGWSMDGTAIPVNYTCTKVNVASCENANNAINQEWYNLFQPYQSVLRCKNTKARDTMQFTNGVMFIRDHNPNFSQNASDPKTNNLFGEIKVNGISYVNDPYYKMYSLAQMGNSKDNVHVFHDQDNLIECCVEVKDNQSPQQWMVDYNFDSDIDKDDTYFEFRYIHDKAPKEQLQQSWKDLVTWMATSNPSPKYKAHVEKINLNQENFELDTYFIKNENGHYEKAISFNENEVYYKSLVLDDAGFKKIAKNWKTMKNVNVYVMSPDKKSYILVTEYNPDVAIYFTETEHIYGHTNLELPSEVTFGKKVFTGFKTDLVDPETNELYQKNYNPVIAGVIEDTYEGTYKYDTYEYRMAKMLAECEDHLIMDSVVYHYLFIERHCMIDNVAKNTFWSTEDGQHWNMVKDYDNDTADGNDNNGKFTRNYGMEPLDELNETAHVFNAYQSVWLNFIHGLPKVKESMFQRLEQKEKVYEGRTMKVWSKDDYLWLFDKWQSKIPERCWVEDYYRKYIRPYELYKILMFNSMMDGGQKKHQRKQYETYQEIYMSSEYFGNNCSSSYAWFRPTGDGLLNYKIPTQVYSDCYIYAEIGQQKSRHRVKRNEWNAFTIPQDNLGNATMNLHPMSVISVLGRTGEEGGLLGALHPDVFDTQGNAAKLRELAFSTKDDDLTNTLFKKDLGLKATELLEKLYLANFVVYEGDLNLSDCVNLRELDATNSTFTSIVLPNNAPIEKVYLHMPSALKMSNLFNVDTFNITSCSNLKTIDFDNVDYGAIDTKSIVEQSLYGQLSRYNLLNINWTLSAANEVDINNKNIPIIEKLLAISPIEDNEGPRPKAISLSGVIKIPSSVYNGSDSFEIYEKYAKKDIYPNLDLQFEGSNAKLFNIKIYDGDNKIMWYKKISKNGTLNEEFLQTGPAGAIDLNRLLKAPTAEYQFSFQNKWKMYKTEDMSDTPVEIIGELPLLDTVDSDIILIPQFAQSPRPYTLKFYDDNVSAGPFITLQDIAYGTSWSEISQKLEKVPYREAPTDGLKRAWNFKGYTLVAGGTNIIPENYRVIGDQSFHAVFEMIEDISTVIHPEWFSTGEPQLFNDNDIFAVGDGLHIPGGPQNVLVNVRGYVLKPRYGLSLKGKITIPAKFNGLPVIGIEEFQNQEITHIFCEKGSSLYFINSHTFSENKYLQYFDFSQNTVRGIKERAFAGCTNLDPRIFQLSSNLYFLGQYAFNDSFRPVDEPVTINIPGSLTYVHTLGFNNIHLKLNNNNTLNVGSKNDLSKVELSWPNIGSNASAHRKFTSDRYVYTNINFYTEKYKDWAQEITDGNKIIPIYNFFIGDSMADYNLYIGTGE